MHTKDARAAGESEQRLYAVTAWRETPLFTDRERAALAWTEAITLIHKTHAPDDVYEHVPQDSRTRNSLILLWRLSPSTVGTV